MRNKIKSDTQLTWSCILFYRVQQDYKDPETISENPVNVLFNTSSIAKKDVWEIDIVGILEMLLRIRKIRKKRPSCGWHGCAIIIVDLSNEGGEHICTASCGNGKKSSRVRSDVDIPLLGIPYRHEPTYPVTLDELLGLLQNLIDGKPKGATPKTPYKSNQNSRFFHQY